MDMRRASHERCPTGEIYRFHGDDADDDDEAYRVHDDDMRAETRFMQCEPHSASKASKHLHVLLDNLQLDPNARNPLFTEKCCHQGAPWRFTQCVSGFKDWNWSCSGTAAATATGLPRSVQRT